MNRKMKILSVLLALTIVSGVTACAIDPTDSPENTESSVTSSSSIKNETISSESNSSEISSEETSSSASQSSESVDLGEIETPVLSISKTETTVRLYETEKLKAIDYQGAVQWQSSNESVATVKNGVVQGVSAGNAVITATATNGVVSCSVEVTSVLRELDGIGYTGTVSTVEEFVAMQKDGKYILTSDIDFSEYGEVEGRFLINEFSGTLEGNGYAVKNLTLTAGQPTDGYTAIFGRIDGVVKHLGLENIRLNAWGEQMIGESAILAHRSGENARLENLYVNGSIQGVTAVDMGFTDYREWGLRTGVLVASVEGPLDHGTTFMNIIIDVSFDTPNNEIRLLMGRGNYKLGSFFVLTDGNANIGNAQGGDTWTATESLIDYGKSTESRLYSSMTEVFLSEDNAEFNDGAWESGGWRKKPKLKKGFLYKA